MSINVISHVLKADWMAVEGEIVDLVVNNEKTRNKGGF
jgi:hypothetical protein